MTENKVNIKTLIAALGLLFVLSSCQVTPTTTVNTSEEPQWALSVKPEDLWQLAPNESHIRFMVFKAGALSRFGHDHVIRASRFYGQLDWQNTIAESKAEIQIPVQALMIDEAKDRDWSGYFTEAKPISDADRQDTLNNLLSDALLDGQRYPWISIEVSDLKFIAGKWKAQLTLRVKDKSLERVALVDVTHTDHQLVTQGELVLSHQELGLTPYSALGGALKVDDPILVFYRFTFSPASNRNES